MKCHSCGAEIADDAKFCKSCGVKQPEPAPAEEEIPTVTAEEAAPVDETPVVEEAAPVEAPAPVEEIPPVEEPAVVEEIPAVEEAVPVEEPAPIQQTPPVRQVIPPVQVVQQVIQQEARPQRPALQLPTHRGMLKYFLLMIPTFFIYPTVIMSKISTEINIVASRYDGKRTNHFLAMALLTPLTLCIYLYVWYHKLCGRIGDELARRKIDYKFGAGSFWLWNILWPCIAAVINVIVTLILSQVFAREGYALVILISCALAIAGSVGMFIFFHKFFKAMNLINADYNEVG